MELYCCFKYDVCVGINGEFVNVWDYFWNEYWYDFVDEFLLYIDL